MEPSLNQIQKLCKQEIEDHFEEHRKKASQSLNYLENSTAKYKEKTIYSLYIPKIFTKSATDYIRDIAETMVRIMEKVTKEYIEKPDYRELFGFSSKLKELILHVPSYKTLIPVARVDIFLNEETGEFKFCEFNTDGSSAMNEDRELCNAFTYTELYKYLNKEYVTGQFELFDSLVQAFLTNYQTYPGHVEHPRVAVMDFLELGCSMEEFKEFCNSFERAGCKAKICDIRQVRYNHETKKLLDENDNPIDLIYRRAVTSDILEHAAEVGDFIRAVKEDAVCCMGSFCTQVAHDKSLFYILHNERTKQFLTEDEWTFVQKHIPFTDELTDHTIKANKLLEEKNKWLIKPKNSYGARGIYAGVNFSDKEWKKAIRENRNKNYILQEFIRPYQTENIDFRVEHPQFKEHSNLTGLYVYNGRFAGVYSRQANHEIISSDYDENDIATITLREK